MVAIETVMLVASSEPSVQVIVNVVVRNVSRRSVHQPNGHPLNVAVSLVNHVTDASHRTASRENHESLANVQAANHAMGVNHVRHVSLDLVKVANREMVESLVKVASRGKLALHANANEKPLELKRQLVDLLATVMKNQIAIIAAAGLLE